MGSLLQRQILGKRHIAQCSHEPKKEANIAEMRNHVKTHAFEYKF